MQGPPPNSADPPDETTVHVRRALTGSRPDLDWLIQRIGPLLTAQIRHRLGSRFVGRIDPEDVLAETWFIALPKLAGLESRAGRFTPVLVRFLAQTATFVANNRIRECLRHRSIPLAPPASTGVPAGPMDVLAADITGVVTEVARQEATRRLVECIESLPERDRRVVIMRGIEGQSVGDIARQLGALPDTVSQWYRRALHTLREIVPSSVFDELVPE